MNEDKIIGKLIEHDERFEAADEKLSKFREEVLSGQDAIMTVLKKLDEKSACLMVNVLRTLRLKQKNTQGTSYK